MSERLISRLHKRRAVNARNVKLTTFDTESELMKIKRWAPDASLLLRIRADDKCAQLICC